MRNAVILIASGIIPLLFIACGGGGGGTPTPMPTPTVAQVAATLVQITGTAEYKLEPNVIKLKVGEAYRVQFLNRGQRTYRLRIPRWGVALATLAGADSDPSNVFTPEAPGEFDCYEEFNAAKYDMRCKVVVSP